MEELFLDTSFLIALTRRSDENHVKATEIIRNLDCPFVISDHILDETITYLRKKGEQAIAHEVGIRLLNSANISLHVSDKSEIYSSFEVFIKYNTLSFCDALSIVIMKKNAMHEIVSFDSDFDGVPGITRIH